MQYRRINIVGTSGSGKSTFGRQLAERLSIPYFEMDQLFWKAGWVETPGDVFMEKIAGVTSASE